MQTPLFLLRPSLSSNARREEMPMCQKAFKVHMKIENITTAVCRIIHDAHKTSNTKGSHT
uniref:Uncharacterized protein n=1 Tax=Anguilla anguilla TaxID=7936 RepID=A0A0E9SDY0_ANGAN